MVSEICYNENFNDLVNFINKHSIKQLYVSDSLIHLKSRFLNKYSLVDYNNKNEPCIFFGVYMPKDYKIILQHNTNNIFVMFGGSDLPNIRKIKINNNITYISISENMKKRLNDINYKSILVDLNLVDNTLFKPVSLIERGNKIFVYNGIRKKFDNDIIYNQKIIDEIIKKIPEYHFIFSNELNAPYEKMPEIYSKCFIGLRLTDNDGNANMVQEMNAMNIPVVHNHNVYGLKWKTIEDVINYIHNHYKILLQAKLDYI